VIRLGRGKWKGHLLRPSSISCRPTSSKVRGAFLDIAGRERVEGSLVWDLCAGSGAVGLEALSWGAQRCVFVDRNPACTAFIREFLREHDARESAKVITGDVRKYIKTGQARPGLVFADPPYGMSDLYRWLEGLDWRGILGPSGGVFIEYGSEPPFCEDWQFRKYGDSYLRYMIRDGDQ
jgi:16S rRNA (guanine966-N2)-methyltransferase